MNRDKVEEKGLTGTGKYLLDTIENSKKIAPVPEETTEIVASDPDKKVIILNNRKIEVYPADKVKPFVGFKLKEDKDILKDDCVYRVTPETGQLMYQETFQLPEDFDDASPDDKVLLMLNYLGGLVPYEEKKLTRKTMPAPLLKGVYYRIGVAALAMLVSTLLYLIGAATWHIFPLAGFYSAVYLWNAALAFYYGKTRNFKVFSGIVTNVERTMAWSPSLRRTYIQISNGKKFISFKYNVKKKSDIKIGTPVTIFIPNNIDLVEGPLGPTADVVLGISFSLDVKSADVYGEYQDGRMKDVNINEYFNDVD